MFDKMTFLEDILVYINQISVMRKGQLILQQGAMNNAY